MIILSTIIPVYNKEKALRKTLESIVNNHEINDDEYECILVDDESTDNSTNICKEFCKKYSYFKYIRIFNDGYPYPSDARNCGLKYCEGKYIHFLDADDELCKTFYKDAIKILDTTDFDVFSRGNYSREENEKILHTWIPAKFTKYKWFGMPLCSNIFRNYIKEIKFENVFNEDIVYTWLAMWNKTYYDDTKNFNSIIYNLEYCEVSKHTNGLTWKINVANALSKYPQYPYKVQNNIIVKK